MTYNKLFEKYQKNGQIDHKNYLLLMSEYSDIQELEYLQKSLKLHMETKNPLRANNLIERINVLTRRLGVTDDNFNTSKKNVQGFRFIRKY